MNDIQQIVWPKVTVVIVNWNGEPFLERCLSALLAQTVAPSEIIMVDNASSDTSLGVIRRFPSVRLLSQAENLGFARGNNLAIELANAESEWIALLNPDAFVEPRWLEQLLLAAHNNPAYKIFTSKFVAAKNTNLLDGAGDAYHISGWVWRIGRGEKVSSFPEQVRDVFSPCAAAALYRRSAILEANGFDEDYFCYVEDVDLGFRLRLLGYRCLYVPESVVYHIGSAITGDHSDFSIYHGHRNLVWTYLKNMPGIIFWLALPLHILLNFFTIMWFGMRGKFSVILRSKVDAFQGIPRMWQKRREIQKNRKVSAGEIWKVLDKRFLPGLKQLRQRWF